MKWTSNYLWDKIESVVPNVKASGQALPEALKSAAVILFLSNECTTTGSYRAYVIQTAIKELAVKGFVEFGDVNTDWG